MTLSYELVMELLPAYAIGALDEEEQNAVDEYFEQQESLRLRLVGLEQASTLLAQDAAHVDMVADGRSRLMARVLADADSADVTTDATADATTDAADGVRAGLQQAVEDATATEASIGDGVQGSAAATGSASAQPATGTSGQASRPSDLADGPRVARQGDRRANRSQAATRRPRSPQGARDVPGSGSASIWQRLFNGRALVNAGLMASAIAALFLAALSSGLDNQVRSLQVMLRDDQQAISQTDARLAALAEENRSLALAKEGIEAELLELQIIFDETDTERAALYAEYQRLRGELAANNERITLVGAASQATVMFGTDEAPGLQGTFFHKDEEGALVVHGLEPLPADQTYQFWLVTENGEQVPAGLFLVDENAEPTWATLVLPRGVPEYVVVGVTIEPAAGSPFPTGPMLLESPTEQGFSF